MDYRFIIRIASLFLSVISFLCSCEKTEGLIYPEKDRTIRLSDNIVVDNGVRTHKPVFNLLTYNSFLDHISTSGHFIIVPLKYLESTNSTDKVIISLRYDIDWDMKGAIKMAYRERKYNIRSTYFVLHTAGYYGTIVGNSFIRNDNLIYYLKYIQDSCYHEIGFHNDLLTLQIMYEIPPKEYLRNELSYLRDNNIDIVGTTSHGSQYCNIYKYYNAYFWKEFPFNGGNYTSVVKGYKTIEFEKDSLKNYNLKYQGELLKTDYFFTDVKFIDGQRWNMNMVNFDTIKAGKKVIILLHPGFWD